MDQSRIFKLFVLLDNYLGHGRMLESALIFVKIQYALIFLVAPPKDIFVIAFADLDHPAWVLALPFAICASLQFTGISLNILGFDCSRWFRIIGASIGMAIWTFMLIKNCMIGYYVTGLNPWMLMAIVGSVVIIRKAFLNLPIPGAAGAA